MNLAYKRSDRLGKLLQREVSKIILEEIKDPRLGFITITALKLTDDLSLAKVFFSALGEEKEKELSAQILNRAKGFIRYRLGEQVEMRKVPEIMFIIDESIESAAKVFTILNQLEKEHEQPAAEKPSKYVKKRKKNN